MNKQVFLPLAGMLACGLLWGSAFPGIKSIYLHWGAQGLEIGSAERFVLAGIRFIIAGLLLTPFVLKLRSAIEHPSILKGLLRLTICQIVCQYIFFYSALAVSSGTLASLLVGSGSLWLVLISAMMKRSPWPTGIQLSAIGIGALGVIVAVYAPGAGAGDPILGAVLIIIANAFGAIGLITFKDLSQQISARGATGFALFCGGLVLLITGAPALPKMAMLFDIYVCWITLWLAFVSAAAFSLFNYLSTRIPIHTLATYRFVVPLCAIGESLIFLEGESAGTGLVIGTVLVVSSMILVQRKPR